MPGRLSRLSMLVGARPRLEIKCLTSINRYPPVSGRVPERFKGGISMNPLVVLAFWISFGTLGSHATPHAANQNVVRVCSVATGGCQEYASRLLEPAAAGGQRVFIDPGTKTIAAPTAAQLEKLAVTINESTQRGKLSVETMPDGTLRLRSTTGFNVEQTAVIEPQEKKP